MGRRGQTEVFRSPLMYGFFWACAIGIGLVGASLAFSWPGEPDPGVADYLGVGGGFLVAVVAIARGTRMRIEADDKGVVIFGYLGEEMVPWDEYDGASCNYGGLHVQRRGGEVATALMLGKPNYDLWLNRRSRADEVVARLDALALTYTQRQP